MENKGTSLPALNGEPRGGCSWPGTSLGWHLGSCLALAHGDHCV